MYKLFRQRRDLLRIDWLINNAQRSELGRLVLNM